MKKYLILLIPLLFLMAQCHKSPTPDPEPDLPPATQEGKGTIGCYINGKPWVPKSYISIGGPKYMEVVYRESDSSFFALSANIDGSLNQTLYLRAYETKLGDNKLSKRSLHEYIDYHYPSNCEAFRMDTTKIRNLKITKLDKTANIISGSFELTVANQCGDTLKFTQGRFDTQF